MLNNVTLIFGRIRKGNRLTLATDVVAEHTGKKSYMLQTKKYLGKYWRPEIVNLATIFSNISRLAVGLSSKYFTPLKNSVNI